MHNFKKNSWLQGVLYRFAWLLVATFLVIGVPVSLSAEILDGTEPVRLVPMDEEIAEDPIIPSGLDDPSSDSVSDNIINKKETIIITDPILKEEKKLSLTYDDLGLLDQNVGGFSEELWDNTRRKFIIQVMPRMPIETDSRAIRAISLKLLLSPGRIALSDNAKEGEVLLLRAKLLAQMGEFGVASALLRIAKETDFDDTIALYDSEQYFLNLDFDSACDRVREQIGSSDVIYWQRALIFCQSKNNEIEAASLGLDLLRESGDATETFTALIHGISGIRNSTITSLPSPSLLLVAMFRNLGMEIPLDAINTNNPALLRLIAGSEGSDMALRLKAAEKAEAIGALPAASVGALYEKVTFDSDQIAEPVSQSLKEKSSLGRALLYQATLAESLPIARAEILATALRGAQETGSFPTMARVLLPAIKTIFASPEFAWFANDAGRAFFTEAQHWEQARKWYELALSQRDNNRDAFDAALSLWPLIALTEDRETINSEMLDLWWSTKENGDSISPGHYRNANLLFTLLSSLGYKIPDKHWDKLLSGPLSKPSSIISPALYHALRAATDGGRVGETVLLSALAFGTVKSEHESFNTLGEIISALHKVGLTDDARAIAIEMALAAGL